MSTSGENKSFSAANCTAIVVFVDIVGFSTFAGVKQAQIIQDMKDKVVEPTLGDMRRGRQAIILPTGDGLAVGFPMENESEAIFHAHWRFLATLIHWAESTTVQENGVLLRIGLHFGPVQRIQDFNDQPNMIGETVNMAARAMNAADKGQILLYQNYVEHYFGKDARKTIRTRLDHFPDVMDVTMETGNDVDVNVKHDVFITVRPARVLVNNHPFRCHGDISPPTSCRHMVVTLTPNAKPIDRDTPGECLTRSGQTEGKSFIERIARAESIALIQLTGFRMIERLEVGQMVFPDQLKQLWVMMPHEDLLRLMDGNERELRLKNLGDYIRRWKNWLGKWQARNPHCDVRLKLFQSPPYFGASFIDWERPGGFLHVSPYVWDAPAQDCPGFDMEWKGRYPSPTYQAYIHGMKQLLGSKNRCENLK